MTRPRNVPKVESRDQSFISESFYPPYLRARSFLAPQGRGTAISQKEGLDGKLHALLIYDYATE